METIFSENFLTLRRRLSDFEQGVLSRFVKTPFTCLTKRCSEIVFRTLLPVCTKKEGESCQNCFQRVQITASVIFLSESDRNTFGLCSVNVLRVVKTQSFMSHGSFLGNKFVERFVGFQQMFFQTFVKTAFWVPFLGVVPKLLFLCRTERCWDILSWTLSEVWGKSFRQCCQNCFLRVQSMYSGKIFRTVPERHPDRKVFSRVVKTAFCSESRITVWRKCFSEFAWYILALCEQKYFSQSRQNFLPRGRRYVLVMFLRYEQRLFGFWEKVLGTLARSFFQVYRGNILAK